MRVIHGGGGHLIAIIFSMDVRLESLAPYLFVYWAK